MADQWTVAAASRACAVGDQVAASEVGGELLVILARYAIAGAGNGLENTACEAVGENVDNRMLGRVFGAVYGPLFIAEAAAQLVSGPLLEATSAWTVFVVAECGLFGRRRPGSGHAAGI